MLITRHSSCLPFNFHVKHVNRAADSQTYTLSLMNKEYECSQPSVCYRISADPWPAFISLQLSRTTARCAPCLTPHWFLAGIPPSIPVSQESRHSRVLRNRDCPLDILEVGSAICTMSWCNCQTCDCSRCKTTAVTGQPTYRLHSYTWPPAAAHILHLRLHLLPDSHASTEHFLPSPGPMQGSLPW